MVPAAGPGQLGWAPCRAIGSWAGLADLRARGGRREPEAASPPTGGGSGELLHVEARRGAGRARQLFSEKDADARLGDAQRRSQPPRATRVRVLGLPAEAGPRGDRRTPQSPRNTAQGRPSLLRSASPVGSGLLRAPCRGRRHQRNGPVPWAQCHPGGTFPRGQRGPASRTSGY